MVDAAVERAVHEAPRRRKIHARAEIIAAEANDGNLEVRSPKLATSHCEIPYAPRVPLHTGGAPVSPAWMACPALRRRRLHSALLLPAPGCRLIGALPSATIAPDPPPLASLP